VFDSIMTRPEIVVPLGAFAVGVIAIICSAAVKIHRATIEARLKERMIDEGMSPDEMQRVFTPRLDYPTHSKAQVEKHSLYKPQPSKPSC
jgi:hypothetical protein